MTKLITVHFFTREKFCKNTRLIFAQNLITNQEKQPKKNKFQIKKQTKFCTDSKQQSLSGFLVFASKIATILRV